MKCPKCDGSGDVPRPNGTKLFGLTEVMTCDLCGGSGEVEMTNEDWLRSCTTEQLAEEIVNLTLLDKYKLYDQMESAEYEHGIGVGAKKVIAEWLKQPHTNE